MGDYSVEGKRTADEREERDEARREEIRIMGLPKMQKFIREKMGPWQNGDPYYCPRSETVGYAHDYFAEEGRAYEPCCPDVAIRLPLPIDRDNPERGLWGMVDWDHWKLSTLTKGEVAIIDIQNNDRLFVLGEQPTLALLRALARQIGEEVE